MKNIHSEPYKVGEVKIKSTTEVGTEEFCIECDSIKFFLQGAYCSYCGCHSPVGDFYDESISQQEWDNGTKNRIVL